MKKVFRIVPDPEHIGFWNVEQKGLFFFRTWMEEFGEFDFWFTRRRLFSSPDEAKRVIDKAYSTVKSYKQEDKKLNEWRKIEPIYYNP